MKGAENCTGEKYIESILGRTHKHLNLQSKTSIRRGESTWGHGTLTTIHWSHTHAHFLRILGIFYVYRSDEKVSPLFKRTGKYEKYSKISHYVLEDDDD